MKAIHYTREHGSLTDVRYLDRPVPVPGAGEVRVRMRVSGVNPIDWKWRTAPEPAVLEYVPGHDGAGVVDAVGPDVAAGRVGERVWIWAAGWMRVAGTAQEYVTVPANLAVPLPTAASFADGASAGIPALTAHRCLTVTEGAPDRLGPGTLRGRTVLVTGGAGAVGNAAIQLARWSGATVITTVSTPAKAVLAKAAGAHHVVNYRTEHAAVAIREAAPGGVDTIVDVAAATNAPELDLAVLAPHGAVAFYAGVVDDRLDLPVRELMMLNVRWQGVFLYTIPQQAKDNAVAAVREALAAGAFRTGEDAGLPLHRYPLAEVPKVHDAGERGEIVGKALIELG